MLIGLRAPRRRTFRPRRSDCLRHHAQHAAARSRGADAASARRIARYPRTAARRAARSRGQRSRRQRRARNRARARRAGQQCRDRHHRPGRSPGHGSDHARLRYQCARLPPAGPRGAARNARAQAGPYLRRVEPARPGHGTLYRALFGDQVRRRGDVRTARLRTGPAQYRRDRDRTGWLPDADLGQPQPLFATAQGPRRPDASGGVPADRRGHGNGGRFGPQRRSDGYPARDDAGAGHGPGEPAGAPAGERRSDPADRDQRGQRQDAGRLAGRKRLRPADQGGAQRLTLWLFACGAAKARATHIYRSF